METSYTHLIAGQPTPSTGAETLEVLDPALGESIATIPAGTGADVDAAVAAASKAAGEWARTAPAERGALVKAAARRLRARLDEIAEWQTIENGKPLAESRGGIEAGASTLEQYGELGPVHRGRSLCGAWEALDVMVHEPLGVAAVIVPWNDPVAIACGLVGAALVTGNTVVLKPSEKTPLSALQLAACFEDLPPGVLNVVLGDSRAGWPLVNHPDVAVVAHTGSIATGRAIAEACGRQLKKAVLELGGKDAMVVDEGVDPAWAALQAAVGAFANAGQICTSVERIYVHEAVAASFLDELVLRANALRMGNGMDPATTLGPLIDADLRARVHRHVTSAVDNGARCLAGGAVPGGPGFFYPATVLADVRDDMAVMREETFGPVAPVRVVGSFAEAIEAANGGDYGLAAVVLTASEDRAQYAWRALDVGTVKINAAFGGAPGGSATPHRSSGIGFGYGPQLLDELTATKVVHYQPTLPA